ncbi:MAG TPA: hypothetical protein VNT01_06450 [Symbiobacteriaceae bacterium]|nr:hypothetical protein [Symbiobacteriaceae bacterium]
MGKAKNTKKGNPMALWIVGGVAVVAAGVLIGVAMFAGNKPEAPQAAVAVKTDAELKANRNQQGNAAAKVTVVEWGDYL